MTIKEIAALCGTKDNTVRGWIHDEDFLRSNFDLRNRIREKLENGSPEKPSDYDLEETLAIIGDGGKNETLAALLEENVANKNALTISNVPLDRIARLEAAVFTKLLQPETARDPREKQFSDLEEYIQNTLEPNRVKHRVFVYSLYRDYIKKVENPLNQHVFMHKIAMEHPEFKLK